MMEKRKLKIGIDIDDTIVSFYEDFLDYCNSLCGCSLTYNDLIEKGFFGILDKEIILDCLNKYIHSGRLSSNNLFSDFLENFNNLKEDNLCLITSRNIDDIKKTKEFFVKNIPGFDLDIYYDIDYIPRGKHFVCKMLDIEVLVEDDLKNSIACAACGIKVILLDKPWNQLKTEHPNIIRVKDWNEATKKIEEIKIK